MRRGAKSKHYNTLTFFYQRTRKIFIIVKRKDVPKHCKNAQVYYYSGVSIHDQ